MYDSAYCAYVANNTRMTDASYLRLKIMCFYYKLVFQRHNTFMQKKKIYLFVCLFSVFGLMDAQGFWLKFWAVVTILNSNKID